MRLWEDRHSHYPAVRSTLRLIFCGRSFPRNAPFVDSRIDKSGQSVLRAYSIKRATCKNRKYGSCICPWNLYGDRKISIKIVYLQDGILVILSEYGSLPFHVTRSGLYWRFLYFAEGIEEISYNESWKITHSNLFDNILNSCVFEVSEEFFLAHLIPEVELIKIKGKYCSNMLSQLYIYHSCLYCQLE